MSPVVTAVWVGLVTVVWVGVVAAVWAFVSDDGYSPDPPSVVTEE